MKFSFLDHVFGFRSKKCLPNPGTIISSFVYKFYSFIQIFHLGLGSISRCCLCQVQVMGRSSFGACWYVFNCCNTIRWENYFQSTELSLHLWWKLVTSFAASAPAPLIYLSIFMLGLSSAPLIYLYIFMPGSHCFDYCKFVMSWNQVVVAPQFCPFKNCSVINWFFFSRVIFFKIFCISLPFFWIPDTELYLVGCQIFLCSCKYSWVLVWDAGKILRNSLSLGFCFKVYSQNNSITRSRTGYALFLMRQDLQGKSLTQCRDLWNSRVWLGETWAPCPCLSISSASL